MTTAIIVGIAAFFVVAIVLARQTSSRKKEAVQSLAEEKKTVGAYSIAEMADEEIRELGLREISGADGLSSDVVLKVWKDSEPVWRDCAKENLRYVVTDGISAGEAVVKDVHLECSNPTPSDDIETDATGE